MGVYEQQVRSMEGGVVLVMGGQGVHDAWGVWQ